MDCIQSESSALRLGEVLWMDEHLEISTDIIRAVYLRLFELGVDDVRTKLCYARYLLLNGPEWDNEANKIIESVKDLSRMVGIWDSPIHGHHPSFLSGPHVDNWKISDYRGLT